MGFPGLDGEEPEVGMRAWCDVDASGEVEGDAAGVPG